MTFKLGLTGSIGTGKSSTAKIFADNGCAIWDADSSVHRLYGRHGAAVEPLGALYPDAVRDGVIDRNILKTIISEDPEALRRIEEIVHPLVASDRENFIQTAKADILVFDIPLLFETGGDKSMDAIVVTTIDPMEQKARVLARGTMTEAQFRHILDKQVPDAEKRARADYVVVTNTPENAARQVADILADIKERHSNA